MELLELGWNTGTYVFLAILCIVLLQALGLASQLRTIHIRRSADSVSIVNAAINFAYFWTLWMYGLSTLRFAMALAGLLNGVLFAFILRAVSRYKPMWRGIENSFLVGAYLFIFTSAVYEQGRAELFSVVSFVTLFASVLQPIEILRSRQAGSVDVRLYGTFLVGALFWTAYGFSVDDLVLKIVCPIFALSHSIVIALCYMYREPRREALSA